MFWKKPIFSISWTWFSLAYKCQHKDIRIRRMAYLTQFSIPALLNPMINKVADEVSAILLLICSHEVWVKVAYDWSTALCLWMCLCRPSFHLSKLRHGHKHKHKKNELVRFSCAYAYALCRPSFQLLTYVLVPMLMLMHALVKTRLNLMITSRPRIFLNLVFTST